MARLEGKRKPQRPDAYFDAGLQHERTALAWERTAFNILAVGAGLGRTAASDGFYVAAVVGAFVAMTGFAILLWAGRHYDDLHGPLRSGHSPVHPTATRIVGMVAIIGSGVALLVAARLIIGDWIAS